MNISHLGYKQRFTIGDAMADKIIQCLRDQGAIIPPLTEAEKVYDDKFKGIDTWVLSLPDGMTFERPQSTQVKYRGKGPSIEVMPEWWWDYGDTSDVDRALKEATTVHCSNKLLYCPFEPYYGLDDPNNKLGRDAKFAPVDLSITGTQHKIYVNRQITIRNHVDACMAQFRASGGKFRREGVFVCDDGSFLRLKKDDSNGKVKILVFIDPMILEDTLTWDCPCLE